MPEPASDDAEIRVATDALDPNAVVINGGDGPRVENERVQKTRQQTTSRDAPERGDRDPSRRIEDEGDEEYGERVKRRLGQFRRRVGEAEARASHAEGENRRLLGELRQASEASLTHYEQAALARLDAAKREASDAYDSGDGQKVVEANRKLASAQVAVDNVETIKARRDSERPAADTRRDQPDPAARTAPQARFTPRTQEWVDDNSWFETDPEAHAQAIKIHDRLKREGYEIESPEYFDELTKRSRVLFPEHFSEDEAPQRRRRAAEDEGEPEAPSRRAAPVAGVTRTPSTAAGSGPKRVQEVKLTPAQFEAAAIAGVSPTKYAEKMIALRGAGKLR